MRPPIRPARDPLTRWMRRRRIAAIRRWADELATMGPIGVSVAESERRYADRLERSLAQ